MTAAVIGLIGVIVGALFGGVASDIVERRKRRAAGDAAARVIAAELHRDANKLRSARARGLLVLPRPRLVEEDAAGSSTAVGAQADDGMDATTGVEEPGWWSGTPATRAWEAHFDALAAVVPHELLDKVATAYAQIDSWREDREKATTAPTAKTIEELKKDIELIDDAENNLRTFVKVGHLGARTWWKSDTALWRPAIRWGIPLALLIAAAAIVLFEPRDNVNAQTIAAAVESGEGPTALAECDRAMDHWNCSVVTLSGPRSPCLARSGVVRSAAPGASLQGSGPFRGVVPALPGLACHMLGPPLTVTVADTGDSLIVTPAGTPSARERALNRNPFSRPAAERTWFMRAVRAFIGKSPTGP